MGDRTGVREDLGGAQRGGAAERVPDEREHAQHAGEHASGHGRLEDDGRAGEPGREDADPVDLHVVRVPVAPVGVVDGEHVGPLLAEHLGQDRGALRGILVGEGGRFVRVGVQPGVGVRQPEDAGTAEELGRGGELGHAYVGQALAVFLAGESTLAGGRRHQHHPVALGGSARQQPAGEQCLVVRMGVEGHQGESLARVGHDSIAASSRRPRARA